MIFACGGAFVPEPSDAVPDPAPPAHPLSSQEEVVVERCGRFSKLLTAGFHCLVPFLDRPKLYTIDFYELLPGGRLRHTVKTSCRIVMKTEIIDTPQLSVISRDNCLALVDAIVQYKISSTRTMVYSTQNVPNMVSKLLQAQVRNVAGQLDIDQLIESTSASRAASRVSTDMNAIGRRWGINIESVKFQSVNVGHLQGALAKAKNASLGNKALLLKARATRQTTIIDAEGQQVKIEREAEGTAAQLVAGARGRARAIVNEARAEAETARVIGSVVAGRGTGESITRYLLAMKYVDALRAIVARPNTSLKFLPRESSVLQTASSLGLSTLVPPSAAGSFARA